MRSIGFAIAALIGTTLVHFTEKSALQIAITPYLMIALFVLTAFMCVVSAIASILRVIRVDPVVAMAQ